MSILKLMTVVLLTVLTCAGCRLPQEDKQTSISPAQELRPEWETLAAGLERRIYRPENNPLGQLHVLRIDPNRFTFRAHYQPGAPLRVIDWQSALPDAVAFVNANFFDPEGRILGLLVADGQVFGQSYTDRGGTFLVQDGRARLRSNTAEPYMGEPIEQAVQAFPMLVLNSRTIYNAGQAERVSRRTVVAQDRSDHILLMITPLVGMSLEALSIYLPTTDMNLLHALNLDGGGSSLMYYRAPGTADSTFLPSRDPVPAVLAVYAR